MYIVKTEKRTYSYVEDPQHFGEVRAFWDDDSKVIEAFKWIDPHGWVPVNLYDFQVEKEHNDG